MCFNTHNINENEEQNMEYKNTSHIMHLIFTLLFPLWILVWVCAAMLNHQHNAKVDRMKRDEEMRMMRQALARGGRSTDS